MKTARVVLIGVGGVLLLLLIVLAVAFNSSFQTWAARRALATQPDLHGSVGSVSAGWRQVQVRDLQIQRHGAVLTLPSLETDLPLFSAAVLDRVHITRLVAKGWTLDLTNAAKVTVVDTDFGALSESAAKRSNARVRPRDFSLLSSAYAAEAASGSAAAADAFRGLFQELQLPVDFSLDGLELDGEVILPAVNGNGPIRARVVVTGGDLAAGREGRFVVDLSAAKGDGGALTLQATVNAAMDTPRSFAQVAAQGDAAVSGTQFPDGVQLHLETSATRSPAGETYALRVSGAEKQLATVDAELVSAALRITGTWTLDVQDSDLAPFTLGRPLPAFTALGEGRFETGTQFDEVHASGRFNASADRLDALSAELSAIGPMTVVADFDVLQHGNSLRVERLTADVSATAPVASVRALQPFEFNLTTAELRVADPAQDLVGVSLSGVPAAWAQPFLGELVLTGGDIRGEFAASAREGGLALRAKQPLTLTGLSLGDADEPLLRELDLTLNASADYTPQGWQAQVVELSVRHGGAMLLSLDAKAGRLAGADQAIKITGRWSADLPGWLSQPAIGGQVQLSAGTAQGEFTASVDGTQAVEAKVMLLNLVAPQQEALPSVVAELRADIDADGKVTFNAPLLFDQAGRKSDLLLSGTYAPGTPVGAVEARLTSEVVFLEDVQLLALLVPTETPPAPAASDKSATPPWGAVSGQVTLALKRVVYGGTFEATDVGGALRLDPKALTFDAVRAVFGPESDLKLTGGVTFDPSAASAYTLNSDLVVRNFETGPVFHAVDPAKLPTLDAKVDINSQITGEGANLVELAERARGEFQVTSKGGVFRALSTVLPAERMQTAQSALAIVGGLFGGSTAETVNATLEIVRILSEIPFDQLSLRAERGQSLDLLLQDFTLISPNVRLGGAGKVAYVPGRSLLEQSLDLQINLGARGRLGELLDQVKLLKAEKDNLGYSAFSTPIKIGGTLAQTDTSDLKTKLINLAAERTGVSDALNRMLGGGKQ